MERWIRRLIFLQIVLCSLAAVRGLLPGCGSCGGGVRPADLVIGMSGALFYLHAWWIAHAPDRKRTLAVSLGAAAGVHLGLMVRMAAAHAFCLWCVLAAAGCFLIVILLVAARTPARFAAAVAGGIAFLTVLAATFGGPEPQRSEAPVRLLVYERDDCPYCRELRTDVLPDILRAFPRRVLVEFHAADEYRWVRRTPTIVIDDAHLPEVIEGMPSAAYLRSRIELRLPEPEALR